MLLLVLPLLLTPPGVCVCQFVPRAEAPAPPALPSEHAPQRVCSCESCRTAPQESQSSGEEKSRHPVAPEKHVPGCPAADTTTVTLTKPAAVAHADCAAPLVALAPLAAPAARPVRIAPHTRLTARTSIFLSHCALLI